MATYIPAGFPAVTSYIICRDCNAALAFYKKAFGAEETMKLTMPSGSVAHAEFRIGGTPVMMGEESEQWGSKSPLLLKGTSVGLCLYVPDCDATFNQAVAAGATVMRPVVDQFYGARSGTLIDPFGHQWTIATHTKDIPPAEMQKAMEEWMKNMPQG